MKRSLAITATTAMLALSLAGCGADRNGDVDLLPDFDGSEGTGTTASDTIRNNDGTTGTNTTDTGSNAAGTTNTTGTATNGNTDMTGTADNGTGLGSVTGAVNRGTTGSSMTQYGSARYGTANRGSNYAVGGPNSSVYTATNNGGLTMSDGGMSYANAAAVRRAAAEGDRYARMLENGRVHDRDGYLFDGENASYRTY